jgi:hypothetical protein
LFRSRFKVDSNLYYLFALLRQNNDDFLIAVIIANISIEGFYLELAIEEIVDKRSKDFIRTGDRRKKPIRTFVKTRTFLI